MFERIFYSMGIEFNSLNEETKNKLIKNFEKIKEILS